MKVGCAAATWVFAWACAAAATAQEPEGPVAGADEALAPGQPTSAEVSSGVPANTGGEEVEVAPAPTESSLDEDEISLIGQAAAANAEAQEAMNSPAKPTTKEATSTSSPLAGNYAGTLGFPGAQNQGVVTSVGLRYSGTTVDFDVLAKVGHLDLTPSSSLDVIAEAVRTQVPTAAFVPGQGRPLPKLQETDLTSVGMRYRWSQASVLSGADLQAQQTKLSTCISRAKMPGFQPTPDQRSECTELGVDVDNASVDAYELWKQLEEHSNHGFIVELGSRFLYRSNDLSGNAAGVAAELTPQWGWGSGALFLSATWLWLTGSDTAAADGAGVAVTPVLNEEKFTAGFYHRFSFVAGATQVLPRIGLYGTLYLNQWTNQFASDRMDKEIRGYQLEGGITASGHFSGGFNGLVTFGVRRPYGANTDLEFFVRFSPSFGSPFDGGAE